MVSLGLSYDINFEADFVKRAPGECRALLFDKSTNAYSFEYILSRVIDCFRFFSPKPAFEYLNFLRKRRYLLNKGVEFYRNNVSDSNQNGCLTLGQIFKEIDFQEGVFLKVDIEGDELLIMHTILEHSKLLTGLVIEVHRASPLWTHVISWINSLNSDGMFLDHLHVNNYGSLSPLGLPNVVELSFSRSARISKVTQLPVEDLDSPNHPLRPDYFVILEK